METHFLDGIMPPGGPEFRPEPWYNPDGDCIVHKTVNEAVVADRIDDLLTLYRSANDRRRVIGYQIKGVLALIHKFGWDGIAIECAADHKTGEVRLISVAALLLVAFGEGPNTVNRRSAYGRTVNDAANASIPETELCPA
jgi:hypothetical protein